MAAPCIPLHGEEMRDSITRFNCQERAMPAEEGLIKSRSTTRKECRLWFVFFVTLVVVVGIAAVVVRDMLHKVVGEDIISFDVGCIRARQWGAVLDCEVAHGILGPHHEITDDSSLDAEYIHFDLGCITDHKWYRVAECEVAEQGHGQLGMAMSKFTSPGSMAWKAEKSWKFMAGRPFAPPARLRSSPRPSLLPAMRGMNPVFATARESSPLGRTNGIYMQFGQQVDYYARLGIPRTASEREIKVGFRKQAQKWHPDVNQEPGAEAKFQEAQEAYQILSDPKKRKAYDQFGVAGVKRGAPGGPGGGPGAYQDVNINLEDIFETFFGDQGFGGAGGMPRGAGGMPRGARRSGPTQGEDLRSDLEIDFQTAVFGGVKKIRIDHLVSCDTCTGSGVAPGSGKSRCRECSGTGMVTQVTQTPFGAFQQRGPCGTCEGSGETIDKFCTQCSGQGRKRQKNELTVTVPPGVVDGNRLRVKGQGDAGPKGGLAGDLYVFLKVAPDPRFRRDGTSIYSNVEIPYTDAILGTTLQVPTVDDPATLQVPPGTQPDTVFELKKKGAPELGNVKKRGTHFVTVKVVIPTKISPSQKELLQELQMQELQPQ